MQVVTETPRESDLGEGDLRWEELKRLGMLEVSRDEVIILSVNPWTHNKY